MNLAGLIYQLQCRWLPHTRTFDRLIAWQGFVFRHRRLPSDRPLFNDVIYAEKVADHLTDPIYGFTADKEHVKDFVAARVGRRHAVETLAVIRRAEDVDAHEFPADCCIKPTHLSGNVILRQNGAGIDRAEIKRWFSLNHYERSRELQYRDMRPKVIVEPLIGDPATLRDYKVFCHRGEPRVIQIDTDRFGDHRHSYFTPDFEELPFAIDVPRVEEPIERPAELEEMLEIARRLSEPFGFCRVDFYISDRVYVGEITHHHNNGHSVFLPSSDEEKWSHVFLG